MNILKEKKTLSHRNILHVSSLLNLFNIPLDHNACTDPVQDLKVNDVIIINKASFFLYLLYDLIYKLIYNYNMKLL